VPSARVPQSDVSERGVKRRRRVARQRHRAGAAAGDDAPDADPESQSQTGS